MFIQVIQGKSNDSAGLARQNDRWQADLAPGAKGYLGMTGGVADDGTVIMLARFESAAAAKANSERPEQGSWWNETAKFLDEVTFHDCNDVDVEQIGDLDDAGFAQVMQGTSSNKARVRALGPQLTSKMAELRPDVLGNVVAWDGDQFTQVVYFRSEAEAREGEKKMDQAPPELQEIMELAPVATYIDLRDPWIESA